MLFVHINKQIHDRREEEFIVRRPWTEFPGKGQTIDGALGQSEDGSEQAMFRSRKPSQIPGLNVSLLSFLPKIDETVICLLLSPHNHAPFLQNPIRLA